MSTTPAVAVGDAAATATATVGSGVDECVVIVVVSTWIQDLDGLE